MVFLWTGLRCFIYKACAELLLAHSKTPGVKTLLAAEGSCVARAETARMCSQAVFTLHQCLRGAMGRPKAKLPCPYLLASSRPPSGTWVIS